MFWQLWTAVLKLRKSMVGRCKQSLSNWVIQIQYRQYSTLYNGLATFTEVTFVNVHHAQMPTFVIEVCLWYIGFVLVINCSLH